MGRQGERGCRAGGGDNRERERVGMLFCLRATLASGLPVSLSLPMTLLQSTVISHCPVEHTFESKATSSEVWF